MHYEPNLVHPQLFLDDIGIADSTRVARVWHSPRKYPDPVLMAEHPWERWCPVTYGTVLRRDDRFHIWYCVWTRDHQPRACYAVSEDGVEWHKPELGICEFQGSTANNIILDSLSPGGLVDDIAVIEDPDDTEWPLKALFWDGAWPKTNEPGIHLARSADGIHWDRSAGVVLPKWGDRFNATPCKVNGKYILLGRVPPEVLAEAAPSRFDRGRVVWRTESDNLIDWSPPELVLTTDLEDPVHRQVYSATAFSYGDLLLGGMERMWLSPDKLDTEIIWSRDLGHTWQRSRTRPSFIPWGAEGSWDDTWINLPTNGPIVCDDRLWFYYSGRSGAHQARYPHNHGGIGLATLRLDGFASLQAQEAWGHVLTQPLLWPAAELHVNLDPRRNLEAHQTHATGELVVAVRDETNQPLEGFDWSDCVPLVANTIDQRVEWKGTKALRSLAGRRLRLEFRLRDCHLYSFHAKD